MRLLFVETEFLNSFTFVLTSQRRHLFILYQYVNKKG